MLAKHGPDEPLTLSDIGTGEGVSQPYAAKIMNELRQAGLAESVRGRNGGYILARPPHRIRLSDVFKALGEPLFSPSHCEKFTPANGDCIHVDDCTVRDVWAGMSKIVQSVLEQVTLADLVRESDGGMLNLLALAKRQVGESAEKYAAIDRAKNE